jgi:hypothetical protein
VVFLLNARFYSEGEGEVLTVVTCYAVVNGSQSLTFGNSLLGPTWKVRSTDCAETSVTNYQSTLRNIPEERRPHLHRGGSLKSRKGKVVPVHALKAYGGLEVWLHSFLT